jgi:L-lysine exporter family protein LysE/ArgO
MLLQSFIKGFGVGIALIVAIGAQNAYVLTRGICRNHHWTVAFMGSVIDATLISAGILGMGELVKAWPQMISVVTLAGAIFLFVYGTISFKKMLDPGELRASNERVSLKRAVITMLAFSFLNPHVYLDTVILVGSIAIQEEPQNRIVFGAGAVLASFAWFFSLALGGQWLTPWFEDARTWKWLDFVIGIIMWTIAFTLFANLIYSNS